MTIILEHLRSQNRRYIEENGIQQRTFKRLIQPEMSDLVMQSPDHILSTAPTLDTSQFFSYVADSLGLCPVENNQAFSGLLIRCLALPKTKVPLASLALGSLYDSLSMLDVVMADAVMSPMIEALDDTLLLKLLACGSHSSQARSKPAREGALSSAYTDFLERHVAACRPALLKKAPAATSMAIYRRLDWAVALEKGGSKAREKVIMQDLGL